MKKKLNYATQRADIAAFAALKKFPNYTPANQDYTLANVQAVADDMFAAQDKRAQLRGAQRAAQGSTIAAEWAFHEAMIGVKEQVRAQYGSDSNRAKPSKSSTATPAVAKPAQA